MIPVCHFRQKLSTRQVFGEKDFLHQMLRWHAYESSAMSLLVPTGWLTQVAKEQLGHANRHILSNDYQNESLKNEFQYQL